MERKKNVSKEQVERARQLDLLSYPTNVNTNNRIVVYDILDLGEQLKTMGLLVITDAILNRVTENWKHGRRTHV